MYDRIDKMEILIGDERVKKLREMFSWSSLKGRMLSSFIITAVIPAVLLIFFSYVNTFYIVKNNTENLLRSNLEQARSTLDVWLGSYEDILFQIYMNDEIVDMVDAINQGEDVSVNRAGVRSDLRGMFYSKEHIKCITVITDSGETIFYDMMTGSATQTFWLANVGMSQEEIYDYLSGDNETHIIPTRYAGVYATDTYYLFHLGHRIIDYQNVNKQLGVVLVSIDEEMLREIYGNISGDENINFMVDTDGVMVSCPDQDSLGDTVIEWSSDIDVRRQRYREYINEYAPSSFRNGEISVVYSDQFGADMVNVSGQADVVRSMNFQRSIILFVLGITVVVLFILISTMTKNLMSSINRLVATMKRAEEGKLSVRMEMDDQTPTEILSIGKQFNHMMNELECSTEKEKQANERRRKAEISALEAQINPHFLYNTLDTINWMAIDRDEYEISNSITALAKILRYGIDNSDAEVEVEREVEWLKQYLFLQQNRFDNEFQCEIRVSPEVRGWKIHKLLFQPFVENCVAHGFKAKKGIHILKVSVWASSTHNELRIKIWDNGCGMSETLTDMINSGEYPKTEDKNCIGMENAITRIKMYYGEDARVSIESTLGKFTCVNIRIPHASDEEKEG